MAVNTKKSKTRVTPPEYFQLDEDQLQGIDPEIIAGVVDFIRPYKKQLLISLVLMIIGSLAAVAGPYFVKIALDEGIELQNLAALRNAVILYVATAIIQWVTTYIRVNIMAVAGQSVIYDIRAKLFNHIQALSLSFFTRYSVGRLISRVINDVAVLRQLITWAILAVARNLLTIIGILIAMLTLNLKLSLYTFMVLPLIVLATFVFRKFIQDIYRQVRAGISWVNSVLAENINGVRVVQAFDRQEHNYAKFRDTANRFHLDYSLISARLVSIFFPTIDLIGFIAVALVIWLGGTAVVDAELTPGVLVAFVLYIDHFFKPIQDLSRRYDQFQAGMIAGERILELLSSNIDIQDAPEAGEMPRIEGHVVFDKVDFHYGDDPDTPVLHDINFEVQAGQTIALVGETGAGKSTIIKLLGRFYDTVSGQVLIDGHNVKDVKQASLRRQMGIVLQEPFLFGGTVYENIQFGRLDATTDEVRQAAQAVGAHEFISGLRHGYETSVEEGGALLSVGQRQLISFARALLANPRILILDEATSSVDTQTEQIIQEALATLFKGRTSFVIAHRLSTIVKADQIIVVSGGKMVECGTHTELLAKGGYYFKLYSMGFKDQVEE